MSVLGGQRFDVERQRLVEEDRVAVFRLRGTSLPTPLISKPETSNPKAWYLLAFDSRGMHASLPTPPAPTRSAFLHLIPDLPLFLPPLRINLKRRFSQPHLFSCSLTSEF